MLQSRTSSTRASRTVLLVLTVLILFGSLGRTEATVYYSLTKESLTTVSSPSVILQNGTVGTSTIYTNSTSAMVSVSGYGYDFVDNNDTDVDLSTNTGTHSNFTAQKYGPDLINDTLTEENTGGNGSIWLYVNADDETRTDWTRVGENPYLDAIDYNTSYVHVSGAPPGSLVGDFSFADSGKSTETIINVTVQLYAKQSANSQDLRAWVWNGSSWISLGDQTTPPNSWAWMNWTATTVLDTWTKIDGAKIYIRQLGLQGTHEVDCARLQVDYSAPDNYGLNLEVQWTNVDFDETYEELCIKTGAFSGSEDIMAYAWNVSTSDWHFLYNLTASSWNNVSVTDWLNNENFTVRFLGGTEGSDTSQDSWNIDATLLHVWTETDYVYDYVLRVNNTAATESWQIRLKKYSDFIIDRLQNCTIYFHNSTDGTSAQIEIEEGNYKPGGDEGSWYNLPSSETIYVAMTATANSTATSYVRAYLEIRIPDTTTFAQYIITFEIT